MNRARLSRMQRAEFSEMVPNVCFCYCLSMHICYLVLSAHVPQSASNICASKDLVEPVQVDSVGPMYMTKLSKASHEQNLYCCFVILSYYQIDRTAEFSHCKEVLDMVDSEWIYLRELTGN